MKKSVLFSVLFWITIAVCVVAILLEMVFDIGFGYSGKAIIVIYYLFVNCGKIFLSGIAALGILIFSGTQLLSSDETIESKKSSDFNERIEQLKQVNKLREIGAISEEEFELQKKKILER
jgi:uncharacterized membrane protein